MNYKIGDIIYVPTDTRYLCLVADENWAAFKPLAGWGSGPPDSLDYGHCRIYKNSESSEDLPKIVKE
jgi:hypothetical protein